MSDNFYQLIDSGDFLKLEKLGPYKMVRPAAGAVWPRQLSQKHWENVDAYYERFSDGKGQWTLNNPSLPESWKVSWGDSEFLLKSTSFGHLGLFPEQLENWSLIKKVIQESQVENVKVLNLFAYTGGSTLAAAQGGAQVTHIDASKPSVDWAQENAHINGLKDHPIRWIVEDVQKFVDREVRRQSKYHGVILDPPSFGRGPKNQVWKIEEHLTPMLEKINLLLEEDFQFVLLSAHSPGYTPLALENILKSFFSSQQGTYRSHEMLLPSEKSYSLPSGASALFTSQSR